MTIVRSAGRHLGAISAVVAACASVLPSTVSAAASTEINFNQRVTFDIPAQPLQSALMQFAAQANVELSASTDLVEGKRAAAVKGVHSMEDALRTLLAGTGLRFMATRDGSVAIVPEVPTTADIAGSIETVNVFGTLDNELSVGSKSGQSLRETPKSVTIVTRERIEAQNLSSLDDVMRQTTGVTTANYGPVGNWYYSRGFRVQTIQLDGGAPAYSGGFSSFLTPDTASYDHVEMLRGVDGMYTGAGQPGGVINLVRKRALAKSHVELDLASGSWNNYRGALDVTGPLTDDGRLRGRLVGAYQQNDYFYDRAQSEKTLFFGTAEYDITASTLAVVGASYERRKEDGYFFQGLPRYADGRDLKLPRSTALNTDWSYWHSTTTELFARIEQQYGESGVLKLNLTRLEQESQNHYMLAYFAVDPLTLTGPMAFARANDFNSVQNLADLSASGTFELFGREHKYTVGVDYSKVDGAGERVYNLDGYVYPNGTPIDVFNYDASLYPRPQATQTGRYPQNYQAQNGYYATVGLQLAEPLRLTLGGRYGEFRFLQQYQSVAAGGGFNAPSTTRYRDSKFIPSAALTFDFAKDWTAYLSYAETFEVQSSMLRGPLPGTPLDPITGEGYEIGVKGEIFGFLNAAAALYRVKREGQGITDPAYAYTPTNQGASCCYLPQAFIVSEGADVELSGTVLPGWQVFAGYTYNQTDNSGGYPNPVFFLGMTPKHMFKLWTTWQLPGALSRWTVNGGVVTQTETFVDAYALAAPGSSQYIDYRFDQGGYSLLNASVQFRVNDTWTVGLYGDNLLDKTYYQVHNSIITENIYGTPRSYVLSVRGRW